MDNKPMNELLTNKDFMEKYNPVFIKMNELSGKNDDVSVCLDKLVYMCNKHFGIEVTGDDVYPVPADFNYQEFKEDFDKALAIGVKVVE